MRECGRGLSRKATFRDSTPSAVTFHASLLALAIIHTEYYYVDVFSAMNEMPDVERKNVVVQLFTRPFCCFIQAPWLFGKVTLKQFYLVRLCSN